MVSLEDRGNCSKRCGLAPLVSSVACGALTHHALYACSHVHGKIAFGWILLCCEHKRGPIPQRSKLARYPLDVVRVGDDGGEVFELREVCWECGEAVVVDGPKKGFWW